MRSEPAGRRQGLRRRGGGHPPRAPPGDPAEHEVDGRAADAGDAREAAVDAEAEPAARAPPPGRTETQEPDGRRLVPDRPAPTPAIRRPRARWCSRPAPPGPQTRSRCRCSFSARSPCSCSPRPPPGWSRSGSRHAGSLVRGARRRASGRLLEAVERALAAPSESLSIVLFPGRSGPRSRRPPSRSGSSP